jgi:DNA/RNA endonuclease G (NUC1)
VRRAKLGEQELCQDGYASLYDLTARRPVYVVAFINGEQLAHSQARNRQRDDIEWFAEPRINPQYRAQSSDYKGVCDRGHLIANSSSTSPQMQRETFDLGVNSVCQDPVNNRRGAWRKAEQDFHHYLLRSNTNAYFYAGAIGNAGMAGNVTIPEYLWMLVIPTNGKKPFGWVIPNTADAKLGAPLSQAEIEKKVGFTIAK